MNSRRARQDPRIQGQDAEVLACRYLQHRGLRLLRRNFHCRTGELDLVMEDGDNLVFVEVRYRRRSEHGSAVESVDRRKQRRLIRAAEYFLLTHPRLAARPARFDVVGIDPRPEAPGRYRVRWIRNAFEA